MKYERWQIAPSDASAVTALTEAGYSYLLSSVLVARGTTTPEAAAVLLDREGFALHDPMQLKDMDKAVERINRAMADHEKLAVFGDYDVDGITSTVLLTDFFRSRGCDVTMYIPRRIEDGYGLGCDAIRSLAEGGVSLIITVDCGITGTEETAFAKTLGVDLVITDHHECKEELPAAVAVVDPHRPDCPYPFKHLAGVGVALKLVLALGGQARENALFSRYCSLAAIGTIADVMRMEDENRFIVQRGLDSLDRTDFYGLHALLREAGLDSKDVSSTRIGFVLAPRINAAGRMGRAELAAELLLTSDPAVAARLAKELCDLNRERQLVEQEIFAEALAEIGTMPKEERSALVLANGEWHQGVIGIVASRLSEQFSCPSFLIHLSGETGKGSCRSCGGFNLFSALEACGDLLLGFGGHELAAGFTIETKNIPAFRKRINQYVRDHTGEAMPVSQLEIDAEITQPSAVSLEEIAALSALEPYGAGNDRPVFCLRGATLEAIQSVGQNKHVKLRLQKQRVCFDGIFFSVTPERLGVTAPCRVDAAFYLQINEFRGNRSVQLQMIDLRPAQDPSVWEQEHLDLADALVRGETLLPEQAARMLPSREQFVRLWRAMERLAPLSDAEIPLLRRLSTETEGAEAFLRTAMCLMVFAERGLIQVKREEGRMSIRLCPGAEKISLDDCPYLLHLRQILDAKGGASDVR